MDFAQILQYLNVIFRELWQRKFLVLTGFALISFAVLVVGMFWPSKFETSATIYADNQNILGPLLEKQAKQSKVEDRTKVVREKLYSPSLLSKVAKELHGDKTEETPGAMTNYVSGLRGSIKVKSIGSGYMSIDFSATTADKAYRGLNSIIDNFIRSSSEEQRAESREAFLFIDNQVKQYKDQLVTAEEKLKEFASQNFDGRDSDVSSSIQRIRSQIEELKITIDEDRITMKALQDQISSESEFSATTKKVDAYAVRLAELESTLSNLLLSYTEDYPDVISLRYQIADLKASMKAAAAERSDLETVKGEPRQLEEGSEVLLNPLYQELRSRISQVETGIKAKQKRLSVLSGLLDSEFERRQRVAERGAVEAELVRDYDVTKKIYEDMLERKEKARLSMTLNIEGQGVTYRIQEPPLPPLAPSGIRFFHFVLIGPFIALMLIIGLAVAYVLVDPRIRFASRIQSFEVPVLAVIPHVNTPLTQRLRRSDMVLCTILSIVIFAIYGGLAFAYRFGYLL